MGVCDMKGTIGFAIVLLVLGGFAYLDVFRIDSWPAAPYKIVSHRVVPQLAHPHPSIIVWKGEYQLQYEVNGRQYSIWADAADWNEDPVIVESSISHRQQRYTLRYNPANPSEAVARMNSN